MKWSGAAYLWKKGTNGSWSEAQKLLPNDRERGAWFGETVFMEGN